MVKWIKLSTQMFDDEKIKIIESMPDGDSILIIWIRLMTLAGKVNDEGYVYLNEHVPYTPEMLSIIFARKISTVKLALTTFENLGMVEIIDGKILISNWTKHQSVEGLADIKRKEQARLRQAKHRLKQKQLVTPDVTLQSRDVSRKVTSLELEKELDLELERELDKEKPKSKPSSSEQSPDLKFANDRDSIQFQLVGFLAKRMRDNNPKCRLPKEGSKQLDSWCIEIDRMMRLDGREPSEIRRVIDWSQNDDFWKSNILSPKALRKQYDKLFVKMQKPKNKEDRIKANAMSPEVQAWLNSED